MYTCTSLHPCTCFPEHSRLIFECTTTTVSLSILTARRLPYVDNTGECLQLPECRNFPAQTNGACAHKWQQDLQPCPGCIAMRTQSKDKWHPESRRITWEYRVITSPAHLSLYRASRTNAHVSLMFRYLKVFTNDAVNWPSRSESFKFVNV